MKKIASPTRETTYTGRLSVKADYAGRPVLLVRDFFPAFDNHDAFEIVEDRIINSACIDSIPSVFIQVYTRSRHCVKKINRDSFLFFYPLDTKFCFVASFFRNEGGKKKRRGKSELFISKTSDIKVHRRRFDPKLVVIRLSPIFLTSISTPSMMKCGRGHINLTPTNLN